MGADGGSEILFLDRGHVFADVFRAARGITFAARRRLTRIECADSGDYLLLKFPHARMVALLFAASIPATIPSSLRAQTSGSTDSTAADTSVRTTISGRTNADPLRGTTRILGALSAQARTAQDAFERNHRVGLRFYNGGADATCEVEMGRICYWNNNGDVPPPAERTDAKIERDQLIAVLTRAHAADPSDDWVNGMRVRYLIEAEKRDSAVLAARACAGTAWWCAALEGLALHNDNEHLKATQAFDRALKAMPEPQRCTWTDFSWWLESAERVAYEKHPCGSSRDAENTRILRIAQPLWMLPSNDLKNEGYARRTMSRIHSLGRIPYDLQWGDDLLESQMRFGWPTAWSVQNGGVADPRPPSVIGHEPTPSYDFMPDAKALESPVGATDDDWDLTRKKARMRYAPRYASGFGTVPHQFARFKRGDSTLVAGAYRLVRELEMGRAPYTSTLVFDALDSTEPRTVQRDSASAASALLLPLRKPMLASLEVYGERGKRVARVRTTVEPLPADTRLSDYLLLQKGDPSITPSLETNALQAYGSMELEKGATVGLYWEIYRPSTPSAPLQISIRALRLDASFGQKIGRFFGLSKAIEPVAIRYTDNGRPDGLPGRSITLNFPPVATGDYQLTLVVSGAGISDSTSGVIRVRGER